ncbi:hypothetical protein BH24ACT26_BH24ACT26_15760 [soil metagenome]
MVLAARHAYSTVKKLARAARPHGISRRHLAGRAFLASFVAGMVVLGVIGLLAPSQFGQPGAVTLHTGWPSAVLMALIALCCLVALSRRAELGWLVARAREPFVRPLQEAPGFDEAVDALASCPAPLRTRFAVSWVWGPMAWALLGGTFAFSSAYFVVDAILARLRVGWAQPLYGVVFAALSVIVFAANAGRLASWRFSTSVHKEASTGYSGA